MAAKPVDSAANSAASFANAPANADHLNDIATTAAYVSFHHMPPLTYSYEDVLQYLLYLFSNPNMAALSMGDGISSYGSFVHGVVDTYFNYTSPVRDAEQEMIALARDAAWNVSRAVGETLTHDLLDVPRWCKRALEVFRNEMFLPHVDKYLRQYTVGGTTSESVIRSEQTWQEESKKYFETALESAESIYQRVKLRSLDTTNQKYHAEWLDRLRLVTSAIQQMLDERRTWRLARTIVSSFRELLMNMAEGRVVVAEGDPVRPRDWRTY